jgi:hypothetical protein
MSQGGWAQITSRAAVTVDGDSLDVGDLVLLGVLTGEWPVFEEAVALGLALDRAHPDAVAPDDVRREATAFRYAHHLISAADFRAWLAVRELTVGEVSDVLRRRLLRRRQLVADGSSASEEDVIRVLPAEAFCEGVLARLADDAVDWLVAGQLVGPVASVDEGQFERAMSLMSGVRASILVGLEVAERPDRLRRLLTLGKALEQLREVVAEPSEIGRRMKQHALEWTELVGDELRFTCEGAAREARLQITADGDSANAVANRADVAVLDRRLLVGEAPAQAGVSFAAAAVGEVVGPWEEDGRWHVMQLRAKVPPSPENRSLRERAREELLRERISRHAAGRTTRHAEL